MTVYDNRVEQGVINGAVGRPVRAETNVNLASSFNGHYRICGARTAGLVFDPPFTRNATTYGVIDDTTTKRQLDEWLPGIICPRASGKIQVVFAGINVFLQGSLYRFDTGGPVLVSTIEAATGHATETRTQVLEWAMAGEDVFKDSSAANELCLFGFQFQAKREAVGTTGTIFYISPGQNDILAADQPTAFQW